MNKKNLIVIFIAFSSFVFSQDINDDSQLFKEINEQIFDSDNFYPKTALETNKRFDKINGKVKKETIIYSDSVKIINLYNKQGNLTQSKVFDKDQFKRIFNYIYANDGVTLLRQTGVYNLDYKVLKKDKYSNNYYAVKSEGKKQGLVYKYLDTLFVKDSKYEYEYIKQINSKYSSINEYKYFFKYGDSKFLKEIKIFENNIQVGHAKNFYNTNGQVVKQELFWDYEMFIEDTGFPSVRNFISRIKYSDGLINSIEKEGYYPDVLQWKKTIINYDCKLDKEKTITSVNCNCDNDDVITIDIDFNGNWIKKSIRKNSKEIKDIRIIEYY
ncbi:hypothetical protein [Olleya sp. Bg11-27]|uniref:hypothetical protein n=1 Tax=Olleya sp. Bg11-27 TaxID=2058135 RepID=UPI000C308FC9|nr:hypothetical protein [Olleya sp. Bg11-27]AUC74268.1 hypothetical protein CW732_00665 [Olleya sp. Bg11-27]